METLVNAIAQVDSVWTMAAFAIAALLAITKLVLPRVQTPPAGGRRAIQRLTAWPFVGALCFLAALPIISNTYLERHRDRFYRVRVIVVDERGRPVTGATLRTTVSNETTFSSQDTAQVTIAPQNVPADGKVRIFADLASAFMHGNEEVTLAGDLNPTVTIKVAVARDARVVGLVQDQSGRVIRDAHVAVLGGGSGVTDADGRFSLPTNAPAGQMVRLHAEKDGYSAVDQDHPAGDQPATMILQSETNARKRR